MDDMLRKFVERVYVALGWLDVTGRGRHNATGTVVVAVHPDMLLSLAQAACDRPMNEWPYGLQMDALAAQAWSVLGLGIVGDLNLPLDAIRIREEWVV